VIHIHIQEKNWRSSKHGHGRQQNFSEKVKGPYAFQAFWSGRALLHQVLCNMVISSYLYHIRQVRNAVLSWNPEWATAHREVVASMGFEHDPYCLRRGHASKVEDYETLNFVTRHYPFTNTAYFTSNMERS
jgi:hypothetical protein